MADENPLYPESNSFNDRWGGLPVEAPRFNYTPQSSLIESEPRKIEPYKLTPVQGDPFERAAERLRAPYKHVNDIPEGKIPYRSNLPLIGEKFGHIIQSGATSPLAAFRGEFPVSDPETGMPTPEAIQRSQDVAALGGPGMGGLAKGEIIPGTGIESLRVFGKKLLSDTSEPGMALAAAQPFYSAVENAVGNIKSNKMPADQWLGTLNNAKGVKPEEMDWIGLKEHLAGKGKEPVTKQEIQDFVNVHKTELKEVNKGAVNDKIVVTSNGEHFELSELENPIVKKTLDKIGYVIQERTPSRYSQYQLPGGENYREKLLTLPNKNNAKIDEIQQRMDKIRDTGDFAKFEEYQALRNERDFLTAQNYDKQYSSTHWPDDPNVIAHVRMNDRMIEGKKSLHLEEIQSDLHQEGREKGYRNEIAMQNARKKLTDATEGYQKNPTEENLKAIDDANKSLIKLEKQNPLGGIPDAPFKKTWHELALKRMLREAAEKGYDRLSWTPGEAQRTNPKNLGQTGEQADKADKGLRKWYNEIIPQALEKIGKEHGVKMKIGELPDHNPKGWHITPPEHTVSGKWMVKSNDYNSKGFHFDTKAEAEANLEQQIVGERTVKNKVHYIDIPQSLKDQALGKGFPLFSGGHIFTPVAGNPHDQNNK